NLSYYVVEEFSEGTSLEQDEMERLMSRGTATDGDLEEAYQDAMEEDTEGIFSPLETISMGFKGVFSLGEEEVKSLKEEMEGLTDEYFLNKAIDVLFESLYIDRGTSGFDLLMDNLDSAFSYLIDSGNFGNAALILKRFRELGNQKDVFNEREVARITKSISGAGSVEFVKRIAGVFSDGREVDENELKLFLAQLDNNAIIPLFSLASEVQDIKYRKVILESLVTLGRGRIEVLTAAVKDKRWQVARNAVAILGRIGDKTALEALKHALAHPEPNVRREAIRSLGMIGGPKAGDALLYALDDTDQQIRLSALRFLPRAQSFAVLDSLMEIASRTGFPEKPFPERRAVFEVMGEIGQERVLPYMSKLLKKKGLFSSAKKEELRACAAYGLGNIHKTEALDLLKKEVARAKKGGPLSEAISYSVKKLDRPAV
ncbi:MAG TPA: HEAT repeat domain-containing protein, partial [Nitrospirota bacterium]